MGLTYAKKQAIDVPVNSNLVIALGSSILGQGKWDSSAVFGYDSVGPCEWATVLNGQRYRYLNRGVSGEFTYQMNARLKEDVLQHKPGVVVCQNGTNDITQGYSTIVANSKIMYDRIINNGAVLILLGIMSRETSEWNQVEWETMAAVNEFKRQYAETRPGCIYIDVNKYIIDPSNTDGEPLTGMLRDGTHFTPKGAYRVGRAIADVLEAIIPPSDPFSTYVHGPDGADFVYGNELPNPTLLGTGGALGTGCTGDVPDSMRLERVSGTTSGTVVASIAAVGGIDPRREVTMTFTPGALTGTEEFYFRTSTANHTPDHHTTYYEALLAIDVSAWDGWKEIALEVDDQGVTNKQYSCLPNGYDAATNELAWSGVLRTPEFLTTESGGTPENVRWRLRVGIDSAAAGTGIVKVHSPVLRPVNPDSDIALPSRDVFVN